MESIGHGPDSLEGRRRVRCVTLAPGRVVVALLMLVALLAGGCRRGDGTRDSGRLGRTPDFTRSSGGSYQAAPLVSPGRIIGTVIVRGQLPPDTVVRPTSDVAVCGSELTDVAIEHDAEKLAGAVVWIDGLHAGKALPLVKRYDVVNEGCLVRPRVQAATAGGTLNVRSLDPVAHRTRLLREGEDAPIALVTETDAGALASSVSARIGRVARTTVAGVGPLDDVAAVPAAFTEAVRTVRAMVALGHAGTGAAAADLGFAGLVVGSEPDVGDYVRRILGPLLEYDAARGTDLVGTVEAYFAAGGSPRHTATTLHVHVNTVAQRLDRVAALLGATWQQPDRALELQLALRLRRLMPR